MTGMDVYDELSVKHPDRASSLVFVTGGAFTARAQEFLGAVANGRVEKPFDVEGLRALVNGRVR